MYQSYSATGPLGCRHLRNTFLLFLLTISFFLLSIVNAQAGTVTLQWDKNTDSSVVGYKIYYKTNTSGAPYDGAGLDQGPSPITVRSEDLSDPTLPEVGLTGFQAGQTYYFAATAFTSDDESDYSNEVSFENPEDTLNPSAPQGLNANSLNSSNIIISWRAATDNGGSGIAEYEVFRDGEYISSTSDLGLTDYGLTETTNYRYAVRAKDTVGNVSDFSNEVSAKTLADSNFAIRVNCGGGAYIDAGGKQWDADFGFNTGRTNTSADPVHRTEDDVLHQSTRWDPRDATELAYDFDVPDGEYRVNLHFSEDYNPASVVRGRIFSVFIENDQVLDHLDIFAEAGHDTALVKSFDITVSDGNLNITFQHEQVEDSKINAIEILKKDEDIFHVITASAGDFGSISPQGSNEFLHGSSVTFDITADPDYEIGDVVVDGKSIGPVSSYTFDSVVANHTIVVQFDIKTFSIISQAGEHGAISPSGTTIVDLGSSPNYTITPEEGYHVSDVVVDGISIEPVETYTFDTVVEDHTISAEFAVNTYTLTAEAGENGSISPAGAVVNHGGSQTFTIKADAEYEISDVKVDGESMGAQSTHTVDNVTKDLTITAGFVKKTYQIEAKDCANGTITPAGISNVTSGESLDYTFTPDDNYVLSDVRVDGVSVGVRPVYPFMSVTADHTIEAVFDKENQPPVADAGPDQTVEEGTAVTLAGHNSIDPDDGIAGFVWEQIAGPAVSLTSNTGEEVRFTAPDVGSSGVALVFRLTVTDMAGLKSEDTSIVNVTWVNMPPNAETAPDLTVTEGVEVVLDGSSSSDPDDGIKSFQWVQKSGTPVALTNAYSAKAGFIAPNVGPEGMALSFELIVTDQGGLQSSATSIVNVSWINNSPVAEAGPNQIVKEGTIVTLDGSNSMDADDGIVSYVWTQTDGIPVTLSDASAVRPTFTAPNVGSEGAALVFKLTVTDKGGLKTQDNCTVNIGWENEAPVAVAGADMTVSAGSSVILDGSSSSDMDDGLESYQWTQVAGPQVTLNGAGSAKASFIAPDPGYSDAALTFKLTVTDTGGLQSQDTVIVNVTWENMPPLANAGVDQKVNSGVQVVLNGSKSSDPDDGINAYQWTQISGPPVTLSSSTTMTPFFAAPIVDQDGTPLAFTLTVTDKGGLQSADTCVVVVDIGVQDDTQAPKVFINQPVNSGVYETSATRLSIGGTAGDNRGVVKVTWSNSNGDGGVATGTETWSVAGINLVEGRNVITVTAVDAAGNSTNATLTVTREVPVDKTAPNLQINSPTSMGFYFTSRSRIDLKGTCTDDRQVAKVSWKNSAGGQGQATGTGNWAINSLGLSKWFNTITITATDTAGNTSTLDITVFRWPF